jgi:hypothetical protein
MHIILANLLEKYELDLFEATRNMHVVEAALWKANLYKDWSDLPPFTGTANSFNSINPILGVSIFQLLRKLPLKTTKRVSRVHR